MIDVAIKYFLADLCIDACFDQIYKNFNVNLIKKEPPKIGEFFSRISHTLHHEVYSDCIVTGFDPIAGRDNEYIVYVRYQSVTSDIDEDDVTYDMDEEELRDYVRDITGLEDLTDSEVDQMIEDGVIDDDDDINLFDEDEDDIPDTVDLIETENPMIVGLSTLFFTFHK